MRRRIEIKETVIAAGATVRLKEEHCPSLKEKMARWVVLDKHEDVVRVHDHEDPEDIRTFELEQLYRITGGAVEVTGYAYIDDGSLFSEQSASDDDEYDDDPYDDSDTEIEPPSLFDDPIKLQLEEDADDEDNDDSEDE